MVVFHKYYRSAENKAVRDVLEIVWVY